MAGRIAFFLTDKQAQMLRELAAGKKVGYLYGRRKQAAQALADRGLTTMTRKSHGSAPTWTLTARGRQAAAMFAPEPARKAR